MLSVGRLEPDGEGRATPSATGTFSAVMRPPNLLTISWQIDKPKPVPGMV